MILPTMTFIISSQGHDMTRATLDLGLSAYHTNDVIKSHPVQKKQNYLYCPVQIKPIYIYIYFSHKNKVLLSSIKWESESISTVALLSLLGFSLATRVTQRLSIYLLVRQICLHHCSSDVSTFTCLSDDWRRLWNKFVINDCEKWIKIFGTIWRR